VLAAGKSERMGTNKLLLTLCGETVLERVLKALQPPAVDQLLVVVGHRPDDVRKTILAYGASVVTNTDYEKGMTSSFVVGLRAVRADAVFAVLGDQVGLTADLVWAMRNSLSEHPNASHVSPIHQGRRGHPVLFNSKLLTEILSLQEGETLRDVVLRHQDEELKVEGSELCLLDLDYPEDFQVAKKLFESRCSASPRSVPRLC